MRKGFDDLCHIITVGPIVEYVVPIVQDVGFLQLSVDSHCVKELLVKIK